MLFSMLYSGEQILSFKSCLVFYAGDSLRKFAFIISTNKSKFLGKLFNMFVRRLPS